MSQEWTGVEIRIGGVRFGGFDSGVHYSEVKTVEAPPSRRSYEATAEMTMPRSSVDRLLDALMPRNRGASDATLAKRASYRGGRKSRRAFARLRAKGFIGIGTIDGGPPFPMPPVHIELQEPPSDAWKVFEEATERARRVLEEAINTKVVPELVEQALVDELRAMRGSS